MGYNDDGPGDAARRQRHCLSVTGSWRFAFAIGARRRMSSSNLQRDCP
jgi:hypothetical protein